MEVSPARKLTAEGSTSWKQRSEYEVGVKWSPPCEVVSPEREERPLLGAATKQLDGKH
jgi:hypothetical protein